MSIRKDLKYKNYISLDDAIERKSYEHDIEIYEAIKAGRIEWIENKLKTDMLENLKALKIGIIHIILSSQLP